MGRSYTDEEDNVITRRWCAGDPLISISAAVDRTPKAIRLHVRTLGLPARRNKIELTGVEQQRLRDFCRMGATYHEMEKEFGIGSCALQRIMRDLGIQKLGLGVAHRMAWTDRIDNTIVAAVNDGVSTGEIARRIGASYNTTSARIGDLKSNGRIKEPAVEYPDCVASDISRLKANFKSRTGRAA